ncbi:MAG: hypothetical protein Q8R76_10345 [Candidatus Omnitrophota bacterium]|nr:hypothetical protein [Candidatus Omnitrophota bacterium]
MVAQAADKKSDIMASLLRRIYHALISLQIAVVLILLLIVSLSAGTILESLHGAAAAKIIVYNSVWFSALLILLGLNVLTVALSRIPWQQKHTGFLLTHLGIILILIGSMTTRYFMTDGQIVLVEGETSGILSLPEQILEIRKMGDRTVWNYPVPGKPFPWEGRQKLGRPGKLPVDFAMTHYYPKARLRRAMRSAEDGPASVYLALYNAMTRQEMWLTQDDPQTGSVNLGPAAVSFASGPFAENERGTKPKLYLEFRIGNHVKRLDLDTVQPLPLAAKLEGTPYEVIIEAIFRNAAVVGREVVENEAVSSPGSWTNPAVTLSITSIKGRALEEKHHVFANFPDFPTIHGHAVPESGVKIALGAVPGCSTVSSLML